MRVRLSTLALVVVVTLAACGSDDGLPVDSVIDVDGSSGDSSDWPELDGEWLVEELTVDGGRIELDPSRPITLTIDGDTVSGTAACNHYSGAIDVSTGAGHGDFVVSDLSWTEMGCEPEVMAVEQSFLTALQAVDAYEAADGLYVADTDTGTNFHLVHAEPAAAAEFTGTTWVLDTYLEGGNASNWPDMADVTIRFDEGGTVHGATACGGIEGDWTLDGELLSFARFDRTEIPALTDCDDGDSELEALVVGVLEGQELTATIDGQRLWLESQTGGGFPAGLSFLPGDESDEASHEDSTVQQSVDLLPGGGVDGPVMYAARRDARDSMAAEILGTLELDGVCLYATFEGNRYPILWPYGTTWNADTSSVVLPDGTSTALGGEVHGGGGYLDADTIGGYTGNEAVLERAEHCAEEPYNEVAVLQDT